MKVKQNSHHLLNILTVIVLTVCMASGLVYGQVTVGGKLYSGRNLTGWVPAEVGPPNTGSSTGAIFKGFEPSGVTIDPVFGATVIVQNQHSGGAWIADGIVTGNSWSATVPSASLPGGEGGFVVMVSAPLHDATSREFTVEGGVIVGHPTFDPNYDAFGSPGTFDMYLPPLFKDPDGTPIAEELPLAGLMTFTFLDNKVNGEPDDFPEDFALNGVVWFVTSEDGDTLAVGVAGSQNAIRMKNPAVPGGWEVITGPDATRGLFYFSNTATGFESPGLPPGEVIASSTSDFIYLTGAAGATAVDVGWGPTWDFSVIPENTWILPTEPPGLLPPLDFGWTASTEFYMNYTEEGGDSWDPKLYPGDPGTGEAIWHSYVEKLADNPVDNPKLSGTGSITGRLWDADAANLAVDEPFPAPGVAAPGVTLNRYVPDGVVILFSDAETVGDHVVATAEPIASGPDMGKFSFTGVAPGNYKLMMFDIPLDYVWTLAKVTVGTDGPGGPLPADVELIRGETLVPRFFARANGFVYEPHPTLPDEFIPVDDAKVNIRYKSGSIKKVEHSDATGWFNFDNLPEVEVLGHIDVELPPGYRGMSRTETFYPVGRPAGPEDLNGNGFPDPGEDLNGNGYIDPAEPGTFTCGVDTNVAGDIVTCLDVDFNAMSRTIQWYTANYRADFYVEKIPAGVGHINGFVWNDNLERSAGWVSDGEYDRVEERTLHGVTIELWDAGMTTLIADTTTGQVDEAAILAQGWIPGGTWPADEFGGVFVGSQIGYYEFRDVSPGTYVVKVIPPAGFSPSDLLHPLGMASSIVVVGGDRHDINFGVNTIAPLAGEIEGGVFDDLNIDARGGEFTPNPSDPRSLLFAEKAGVPGAPVSVYDHLGYNLGVGFMGNPVCFDQTGLLPFIPSGCPPGEDPEQGSEMERRFAPGVHIYAGNDPAFPGHCPNYLPLILPYTFGQGQFKFEADWSLVPTSIPLDPGCNSTNPFISMDEPTIIVPPGPAPAPAPQNRYSKRSSSAVASSAAVNLTPGQRYRIQGTGFGDGQGFQTASLSGVKLEVFEWTDTYIDVKIPNDAVSGPIVVVTTTGQSNALKVDIDYTPEREASLMSRSVFVDISNSGPEDGSQAHPYNTIQEGLDNIPKGWNDKPRYVFVAAGTYYENIQIRESNIKLVGCGPKETVIDGLPRQLNIYRSGSKNGAGPVIFIGAGGKTGSVEDVSISGFSITGSTVNAEEIGCGIFGDYGNRRIEINTCRIFQNGGYYGGGIWFHHSNHDLDIWSNFIAENGNFGGYGGGISVNDEPEYEEEHGQPEHILDDYRPSFPGIYNIYNNLIFHNYSADSGGGITLYETKDCLRLYGNIMIENTADDHGGAIFFEDSGPIYIFSNVFLRNYSPDDGGAISFEDIADTLSHINIWNNLFAENIADDRGENSARGGALAFDDVRSANIFNNTIVGNIVAGSAKPAGGGIDSERHGHEYNGDDAPLLAPGYSNPKIFNNIIWDNWRIEYTQPGGDEEDLDYTWGENYVWSVDQMHVDNPHLQPEWEKQNNSNSFSFVRYNIIGGGYNYDNQAPTAVAGPDQTLTDTDRNGSEEVQLDGTGSSDPDGFLPSYDWFENGAPLAIQQSAPLLTLPLGRHVIDLRVTDERGLNAWDQIVVLVKLPSDEDGRPAANAGPDRVVMNLDNDGDEDVALDGSGSHTPIGSITSYIWSQAGREIATGVSATASFTVGTHVVKLVITDDRGFKAGDEVVIDVRPGGTTFTPVHDSYTKSASLAANYGSKTNMRIRGGGTSYTGHLKFDVSGLTGSVQQAVLLLNVRQAGPDGGSVYAVSNDYKDTVDPWLESGLNASNAPLVSGSALSSGGPAVVDEWVRFDVTSAISGDGTYSFAIASNSIADVKYSTKEGSYPPELIIATGLSAGGNQLPVADAGADKAVTDADQDNSEAVTLDASASYDPDGSVTGYVWSENGNQVASGPAPVVTLGLGTHHIDLTVTDNVGATAIDQTVITVNFGGGPLTTTTLTPTDDAQVKEASQNLNYASKKTMRILGGSKKYRAFVKFDLNTLSGPVQKATLRLFAKVSAPNGVNIHAVSSTYAGSLEAWSEDGLKYANAPTVPGSLLGTTSAVVGGTWVEVDVTAATASGGIVSLGIETGAASSIKFSTKEGSNPPQLLVQTSSPTPGTQLNVGSDGRLSISGLPGLSERVLGFPAPASLSPRVASLKDIGATRKGRSGLASGSSSHGNLDMDPKFVDPANFDWRLQSSSPAIDQADALMGPEVDLELLLRIINNGMIDMGAFEWRPNSPTVLRIPTGILGQIPIPTPGSSQLYP